MREEGSTMDDDGRDLAELVDGLTLTWHDEWRVAGMTFRRGERVLTESSSTVTSPSPLSEDEARELMESLRASRGGTIQRRRVLQSEWADAP